MLHADMCTVQLFIKLGVRYIVIVDEKGLYRGTIEKVR